jgi:hypothetical protein
MGGGSKGTTSTVQGATPMVDPTMQPLIAQSAARFANAQNLAPGLETLLSPTPQQIPGQTPAEQMFMNAIFAAATGGADSTPYANTYERMAAGLMPQLATPAGSRIMEWAGAPEMQAMDQINKMLTDANAPIGSSPATLQAKQALEDQYKNETLPTIQNQMMLAGLGNSGALGESIARARSGVAAAEVPLLQQEIANRLQTQQFGTQQYENIGQNLDTRRQQGIMNAITQLTGLGGTTSNRQDQRLNQALGAAGQPRELQTQQEQANFLDQQRIQAMIEQLTMGPLNIFGPSLIGQAGQTAQRYSTKGPGFGGTLTGGLK